MDSTQAQCPRCQASSWRASCTRAVTTNSGASTGSASVSTVTTVPSVPLNEGPAEPRTFNGRTTQADSGLARQVSTCPELRSSGDSARSLQVSCSTSPLVSNVLHIPQIPARQQYAIGTPAATIASSRGVP